MGYIRYVTAVDMRLINMSAENKFTDKISPTGNTYVQSINNNIFLYYYIICYLTWKY